MRERTTSFLHKLIDMTTEEIKKIVDDERAEQLTAQFCRHWEVATERLEGLVQELTNDMDTCVEAEVYAAMMRMQSAVKALIELNKIPCAYLFSDYLDRIAKTVSNTNLRQSVMALITPPSERKKEASFFDMIIQSLAEHVSLPTEKQESIRQKEFLQHIFAVCAAHLNPNDLMMIATDIHNMDSEGDIMNLEETADHLKKMRQIMDELAGKMSESLQMMLMWLLILMLLPSLLVSLMQQSRKDGKAMAQLFNKVLLRVRESIGWWNYWKEHRETLRVVNDSSSWNDIIMAERSKERTELGQVAGGLFAKWTTDREAFDADFLDARLSDDALRQFIFHLAVLSEIARELNPATKFGEEQLVNNEQQRVGEAVLAAAYKLHDLTNTTWFPHYEKMWQELIQNEDVFAHLKVTRKSPHNNLFTARFFCHLVGEMKKRTVFGAHSDNDLAEKLTEPRYVGTFRKNIQEGMGDESINLQKVFNTIYQKYNYLAHPKQ